MNFSDILKTRLSFRKIYIGTTLALFTLLMIIVLGYKSIGDNQKSVGWVTHTLSVISKIQKVETELNELGTSSRGYIITSQDRHLNHFQKTLPIFENALSELLYLTRDNPTQNVKVIELKTIAKELTDFHQANIARVKANKTIEAINLIKQGLGQDKVDALRAIIQEMIQKEEALLNERFELQRETTNRTNLIILAGSILAFFLVTIASFMVIYEFKRRIAAQKTLNEASQVQKAILEASAFALIATDVTGKITLFNPAAEKLLGYTSEEMLGRDPGVFHRSEEILKMANHLKMRFGETVPLGFEVFAYRARKGMVESDQWTYIRKDGSPVPVTLSVTAQRDLNGEITGYLGIAYDMTQQLEYEDAILHAKEQAVAGTQAKSEFLANMSHEIRTPMNAIMGMAELLNETELDEEQKKYVEVFQRAGESLLNIINDILDLSKIEAGHFELDKMPFSLSSVVEKSTEIMALKAHQKQLELAVDIDESLTDHFIGDPNRLRQILLNLLGNSIKFTKRGEVLLKIYGGQTGHLGREIILEVQDTGIGMTEEQLKKLFERFNQADSSITKEYGGTGLGLSITKRLVELMDGKIEVQSSHGIGTKFIVHIFMAEDEVPRDAIDVVSLKGKKILIVDDTKTNRFILKKIVDHQGAIAHEAINGTSALEMIERESRKGAPYDLVLLDCRMPDIDGFKVAENVLGSSLKSPLIMMLTSDNRPGDLAKSKRMGLKSYLVKPVLKQELLMEISRAMFQTDKPVLQPEVKIENRVNTELKILLVDDNDENRLVIRSFIKNLPWKVDEAKNGKEALTLFEPGKYDVILMDMQMPVMDGYTATREIRKSETFQNAQPSPVLALTAYALKDEVDKSFEAGCNGHLSKPISKATLIKAIEEYTREFNVVADKDLEELIPDYLENRNKELVLLKEAFAQSNFPYIQSIGHKLRGSAGSYGFSDLSEIGKELEEKSKVMDGTSVRHALNQYQLYLKRVKVSFS